MFEHSGFSSIATNGNLYSTVKCIQINLLLKKIKHIYCILFFFDLFAHIKLKRYLCSAIKKKKLNP